MPKIYIIKMLKAFQRFSSECVCVRVYVKLIVLLRKCLYIHIILYIFIIFYFYIPKRMFTQRMECLLMEWGSLRV